MAVSHGELEQTSNNFDRMISMLGLVAKIEARSENDLIYLSVKTEDPGRLIGRNGQTLNALQHLLNGILLNKNKKFPKVLIDVEGCQDKRVSPRRERQGPKQESNLKRTQQQALDAAKEVKRWGEKVTLQRVKKTELDIILRTLQDDKEIEVVSSDSKNDIQHVTIQLKNL